MTIFYRWSAVYVVTGMVFVLLVRDDPGAMARDMLASIPSQFRRFYDLGGILLIPLAAALYLMWTRGMKDRWPTVVGTLLACTFITMIFPMVKASLPFVVPFWADPLMAQIDGALHFGVDPWVQAHESFGFLPWIFTDFTYAVLWMFPATYLPFLLAVFDPDRTRVLRYSMIYLITFFFLGNVMAGAFMSAGPIYYDRIVGGDSFAGLVAIFGDGGLRDDTLTANLHNLLWDAYAEQEQKFGSGISAFPSIHVAMTALWAVYLTEVSRKLLPVSIFLVLAYQLMSVFLGWHYAVDGYFSILVILALWAISRNFAPKTNVATQLTPT